MQYVEPVLIEVSLLGRIMGILGLVQEHWLGSFVLNLVGYALIIVPVGLLIRKWKNDPRVQRGDGPLYSVLKLLAIGDTEADASLEKAEEGGTTKDPPSSPKRTETDPELNMGVYCMKLLICVVGLQVSYLTWGVLQERVMTKTYGNEKFTNSQFLVFMNRILAVLIAGIYISITNQRRHRAPFYKYSYSSISNTLSSWCQYEALKFVSFPTQVLAKASKVIPVMLMGKVVSNRTYAWHEYLTALLLSVGVSMFLLAADPSVQKNHTAETTVAGVLILLGYMAFDSFTSNWQSEVFRTYKVSSIQMMFGVNLFSCVLTIGSLLFSGVFFSSLAFLLKHSDFAFHVSLISVCSAVGQLFIFHTIEAFGPLIFTLIMTTRQALSILLSCFFYGHELTDQAILGVGIVFLALFLRVYFRSTQKKT